MPNKRHLIITAEYTPFTDEDAQVINDEVRETSENILRSLRNQALGVRGSFVEEEVTTALHD